MRELKTIYHRIQQAQNEPFALATVINVVGSTYRKPGARMLVCVDGSSIGTVSGGCLEADLRERCLTTMKTYRYETVIYEGALDHSVYGHGMGCNGTVEVLIQPFRSTNYNPTVHNPTMVFLESLLVRKKPAALAIVLPTAHKERLHQRSDARSMAVTSSGEVSGTLGDAESDAAMSHDLMSLLGTKSYSITFRTLPVGECRVIVESRTPPLKLIVSGCGHDAIPLSAFGSALGWDVTLVDRRQGWAVPERFNADATVICAEPGQMRKAVHGFSDAAVVIMNLHSNR